VARLGHLALHSGVASGLIEAEAERFILLNMKKDEVMKEAKKVRSKWFNIRLNEDEESKINSLYKRSTSNGLSEYARDVLLKEPVNIIYRNQSADDFLAEMIQLKNELNAIGNNFNQAVHKLHTLDHVSEIKAWAILNEAGKESFMKKADEIIRKVNQIYELWLQK
jgi:predicted nucleic acid-binding OB-fold protein